MSGLSPSRRRFLRNSFGILILSSTTPLTIIGRMQPTVRRTESGAVVASYTLALSDYPDLADVGGSVKLTAPEQLLLNPDHIAQGSSSRTFPIAVTRIAESGPDAFVAVSTYCTHAWRYQLRDYNPDTGWFVCPHRGSTFTADGTHVTRSGTPNVGDLRRFDVLYDEAAGTITLENVLAVADVDDAPAAPDALFLDQNHPNPVSHSTLIRFGLPHSTHVRLQVFTLDGTLVATIADEERPAGIHVLDFTPQGLATGTYFYSLETSYGRLARRIIVRP